MRDLNPRRLSPQRFSRPPQSAALPTFLKKFAGFIVAERLFFVNRPRFALRNIRKKYDGAARCFADLLWRFVVSLRKRDMRRTGLRADQAKDCRRQGQTGWAKDCRRQGQTGWAKDCRRRGQTDQAKRLPKAGANGLGKKTDEGGSKQIRQKDRRRQGQTGWAKRPPKAGR